MEQLFENSKGEAGIILKEDYLMPEYVPDDLLHRAAEIQEIAQAVEPLIHGRQSDNLFIHGNSGTGKTSCVKHVLKQLEDHTSKVQCVYLNCWKNSTRMAVYWQIANALQEIIPRRGLATDEVFQRVIQNLERGNTKILLVLDEIDGLFYKNEEKLLYELARSGNGKPLFGIIGISNNPSLLNDLDMRIKSSLRFSNLEFKPYSGEEIYDILNMRAKASLIANGFNKEIVQACARKAFAQKSNVRIGLELLWKAAHHAEKKGRNQIELEDLTAAEKKGFYQNQKSLDQFMSLENSKTLSDAERLICDFLKKGERTSTEVYQEFEGNFDLTKRQIRNYLYTLAARNLIVLEDADESNSMLPTKTIRLI